MSTTSFPRMVERLLGKPGNDGSVDVPDDVECIVLIGEPGQAMAVQQVQSLAISDDLLELQLRDSRGRMCVLLSAAHGLQVRPRKGFRDQRTGF